MVERGEIVKAWRNRQDSSSVLATLVRVEGSSYRRPGARMYVHAGTYTGSISGGCLEGEIVRKAAWLIRFGAAVQRYSTLFDNPFDASREGAAAIPDTKIELTEPANIPYGLGCGGVIDLLLEPIASPETEALLLAFEAAQNGEAFACATVLPSPGRKTFARALFRENGEVAFASEAIDAAGLAYLSRLVREIPSAETASVPFCGELRDVFLEPILPPQRLVIFGAGEDARPLARMAKTMGWRIAVADGRAWLAQASRFPEAAEVIALEDTGDLQQLRLTSRDAVAMLTHSFEQDRKLLPLLLPLDLRYLGLLGARNRSQLLLAETAQQLGWTPEECLRRVHAPIGLDLGGDSPEAVALTIVAEIQSVLHAKHPASRSMSGDGLHAASFGKPYVPMQCPLDDPPQPANEPLHAS